MQGWQIALLVVSAVFVGMWIPVSLQLVVTLRSGRRLFDTMGSRGKETLTEVSTTMDALNQTIAEVGEVAHAALQIKDSVRTISSIGAAVGPAVMALVRGLRDPEGETKESTGGSNGASVSTDHSALKHEESTL